MNIQELILAGLETKFTGADKAILTRIAEKKAVGVTDESQVNSIVEGISFTDVLNFYGDYRANGAAMTAKKNAIADYEKLHNIKDGKPIEDQKPQDPQPKDDVPAWAAAMMESNKKLVEEITALKSERNAQTRAELIRTKAKEHGIPETLIPMLKIADDADLDAYMKDAKQTFANLGFAGAEPPTTSEQKIEKENESIAKMINAGTEALSK